LKTIKILIGPFNVKFPVEDRDCELVKLTVCNPFGLTAVETVGNAVPPNCPITRAFVDLSLHCDRVPLDDVIVVVSEASNQTEHPVIDVGVKYGVTVTPAILL
jgi:hypothetical protein